MGIKNCLILFIVFTLGIFSFFPSVYADDVNVNIHMLGEDARTRFDNPVIVAGIWHYINITLNDQVSTDLTLKFYKGDSIPAKGLRDETNYYEWKYNANNQVWTDENEYGGNSYINDMNCQKTSNTYSFYVGVADTLSSITDQNENWTLDIYKDGGMLYSEKVVLEKPIIGPAKYHADVIKFYVEPFTELDVEGDDYFIVENVGNVPLEINIDYKTFNDLFEVTNSSKKLSPYGTFNLYFTLHSESWKPGILKILGTNAVIASIPNYLIVITAPITFNVSQIINAANLEVYVGHSNYIIQELPGTNIVFQYEKELEMNEGQIRDINVYISGEGNVTLDIRGDEENLQILKVTSEDKEGSPLTITSTNTSENTVTIRVEALKENKVGIITYNLMVDGEIQTFSTKISIGPPLSQQETSGVNLPSTAIVVALCIIFVIVYISYTQIRHKRR
jgi:hypothetical protein